MADEAKKRIGDYEILDELGSGGMGRVYRVRNVISDRVEAMKVLLPDLAGRQELAARFLREIKVLASLNHPNIAQLRTALEVDNQLVMIMEYVEGTTLAARLERGPIPTSDALNYIDQVLDALSYAHKQGIIHRDIKPSNMMLTPQGMVKLMDFGIARSEEDRTLTQAGTTMGSLSYMSPEQVKGETCDARSDLYSVGVSLYEMVTGQRPFQSGSDYSIMAAHVKEAPKPPLELQPTLPPALNEIILMAIAKDPGARFQSAAAFRNALSQVRGGGAAARPAATTVDAHNAPTMVEPPAAAKPQPPSPPRALVPAISSASPPSVISMAPPAARGHRGLYVALGAFLVLAVLLAAAVYTPWHSKTQDAQADSSQAPQAATESTSTSTTAATPPEVQPASTAVNPTTPPPPAPAVAEGSPPAPAPEAATSPKPSPFQMAGSRAKSSAAKTPAAQTAEAPASGTDNSAATNAPSAAELDELEHQVDQLTARVGGINSSLDAMQRAQNGQGYGLRGDISSRQESMKVNLQKAQSAVERNDAVRAKRYIELTQGDVEALERFLGR
jgi:eukaryotic-like serine/threonine-protein kinase